MSAATNPVIPPPSPAGAPEASPPEIPQKPRSYWWILGLLFIAGTAWLLWSIRNQEEANQQQAAATAGFRSVKATTGTVARTMRLAGQTSARKFANITAPILRGPDFRNAMVLMSVAKGGSQVKQGDQLAAIDFQMLADRIDDQRDTVEAAQADVKKQGATQARLWENLQQTLRSARADADKWKLDAGAGETRTDLDRELLKLGVEEAEARYKQLLNDVGNTKASHAAQLRVLEITVERHRRRLERFSNDIKRFRMTAPMSGLVVMQQNFRGGEMQQYQQGDQVFPGTLFMKVVDLATMQIEANINQSESGELRIGQQAIVGLDAFPGLEFKGKVYSVGALATRGWRENYYIRNIPVRIQIEGLDPRLIPDLSGYAEIQLGRQDNAVIVPLSAIRTENGKQFVEVKKGENRWERREIQTGLTNQVEAAVVSGVSAGDELRVWN